MKAEHHVNHAQTLALRPSVDLHPTTTTNQTDISVFAHRASRSA
jgi:hypothetical protein